MPNRHAKSEGIVQFALGEAVRRADQAERLVANEQRRRTEPRVDKREDQLPQRLELNIERCVVNAAGDRCVLALMLLHQHLVDEDKVAMSKEAGEPPDINSADQAFVILK
jgi:hypothetical protein